MEIECSQTTLTEVENISFRILFSFQLSIYDSFYPRCQDFFKKFYSTLQTNESPYEGLMKNVF